MSIIQLTENNTESKKGIERKIDQSFQKKMIDIVQKTQYQMPVESCIRELVSNSVDAINEKIVSKKILSGQNKVEDFYINRTSDEYSDSNFDPTYYNLDWFDSKDDVTIELIEGEGTGFCDKIIIKDTGVGLSPARFYKVVNHVGYSTKRNTNEKFGSFGIGNKAGLATGVDFYTMITNYNGKRIKANIYNHKTEYLIGKFNTVLDKENELFEFDGTKLYVEETTSKNGTELIIPCKRFNRDKFINAVKSQLLYFNKVKFFITYEGGDRREVDFKATVLYSSKNIIISDNSYYSKPHILITKDENSNEAICYGFLKFEEIELEQLYSSVGIKCQIRSTYTDEHTGEEIETRPGIDVVPSRESIIYNDHTRNYILEKFKAVQEEASTLVESKLKDDDILSWCIKASNVMSNSGSDTILNRLSKIIDKTQISPKFNKTNIRFKSPEEFFKGLKVRQLRKVRDYKENKDKIERETLEQWTYVNDKNIFWKSEETNRTKEMYLFHTEFNHGSIITIEEQDIDKFIEENAFKIDKDKSLLTEDQVNALKLAHEKKLLDLRALIISEVKKSKLIRSYDDIVVPDDWKAKLDKEEVEIEAQQAIKSLTPAELRKLNEKTIVSCYRFTNSYSADVLEGIIRTKQEPKISELLEDSAEIIYGDVDDEEKLKSASYMLQSQLFDKSDKWGNNTYLDDFKIILVANANKKYVKTRTNINTFFKELDNDNVMTMNAKLIKWYTGKLISDACDKFEFIDKPYRAINAEVYDVYKELDSYMQANYSPSAKNSFMDDWLQFTDTVFKMQLFVSSNPTASEQEIKDKSMELFGAEIVKDGCVVDLEIYNKLQWLIDYCEPIYPLFNEVKCMTEDIKPELEMLINEVVTMKGLNNYKYVTVIQQPHSATAELQET